MAEIAVILEGIKIESINNNNNDQAKYSLENVTSEIL